MAILARGRAEEETEQTSLLAEINVTPFVDVMLVLLVIFMVAAPLMMAGVPLHLPKTAAARVSQTRQPIVLSINRRGQIFIGQKEVTADALATHLRALAKDAPEQTVYLRADRGLPYGQVMQTMGAIAASGLSHISLLSEQAPLPAPR